MQTFLPFSSFKMSAAVLDDARLRKQKIEAGDILKTLAGESEAWKNHPAVLQWKGYEASLVGYGLEISKECVRRGFLGDTGYRIAGFIVKFCGEEVNPPWLGRLDIHSSHRSRLLFKGRVDAACYSLRFHLKLRSINEWLKTSNYPEKNLFKHMHIIALEEYCKSLGVTIQPNWYSQFNWMEDDTQGYIWPVRKI